MLLAMTRPFRACGPMCGINAVMTCSTVIMVFVMYTGLIEPLHDTSRVWTPTSCAFTADMTFDRVKRGKHSYGWRVMAPVKVYEPGMGSGAQWQAIAHRWPSKTMSDASKAELFWWWLGIGGEGKVLVEPVEKWFGMTEGEYAFATPIGKRVSCWYLPEKDGGPPRKVKLANEYVAVWGFYIGIVFVGAMVILMIVMSVYFCSSSWDEYTDEIEKLERQDERKEVLRQAPALRRANSRAGQLIGARAIQRSNSHFDLHADPSSWYMGSHEAEIRNGFLRKVYGIITAQVLLTILVSVLFMYYPPFAEWVADPCFLAGPTDATVYCDGRLVWGIHILTLLTLFACFIFKNEYPLNYICLFAFTMMISITVGIICSVFRQAIGDEVILLSFCLTAFSFVSLTLMTLQSRIQFDWLAFPLLIGLLLLILTGCLARVFHLSFLYMAYSYAGAAIFMIYIVFDTYMITKRLGYDDYIIAAIELYLDIINLFLFILRILASSRN